MYFYTVKKRLKPIFISYIVMIFFQYIFSPHSCHIINVGHITLVIVM